MLWVCWFTELWEIRLGSFTDPCLMGEISIMSLSYFLNKHSVAFELWHHNGSIRKFFVFFEGWGKMWKII